MNPLSILLMRPRDEASNMPPIVDFQISFCSFLYGVIAFPFEFGESLLYYIDCVIVFI